MKGTSFFKSKPARRFFLRNIAILTILLIIFLAPGFLLYKYLGFGVQLKNELTASTLKNLNYEKQLREAETEILALKSEDQYLKNKKLEEEIKNIHSTYQKAVETYKRLSDFKESYKNIKEFDVLFASILSFLSEKKYASAGSTLAFLNKKIEQEKEKSAGSSSLASVLSANTPPESGFRRQSVQIGERSFTVSIISADLNSTRVLVDTASDSDCSDNCPVLSLADFVSRNGAFAAVNGSYFCPATYPDCTNKKNSFDTLLMNKNKRYFNSDNNVYSVIPAVIFSGSSARFVTKSLEWGRDTSVDAVIANHPLLVFNGGIFFGGDSTPKHNNKGGRSFVGTTGNKLYIGVVHNATVLESAQVLKTLGVTNALNLDDSGSTALWYSGYKVGPGRAIPNAVVLVRK